MKYKHMAIGEFPAGLVNLAVLLEFTPGGCDYELTILDAEGQVIPGEEYMRTAAKPFDNDPPATVFDMAVYFGLGHVSSTPGRLTRDLAGFAFTRWIAPAVLPSRERAKYEAVASQ